MASEEQEDDEGKTDDLELGTVRHKYTSAYVTYCRCNTRLRELIEELSAPIQAPRSETTSGFGFKLPPCEIPIFDGNYSSWPTFRDIFEAVCIRNPRLSSVERLFHLSQKTRGEANDIVGKVPLTNENFKVAWANLCSRYENRRVLINIQLKRLFGLTVITDETAVALKALQRDINSCIELLRLYEVEVEEWDAIFIFICSNCLPNSTLTLWEQTLCDKTIIPKWSKLDKFLTDRHRTLESVSEIRRQSDSVASTSRQNQRGPSRPTGVRNGGNVCAFQTKVGTGKCHLCPKESHVIRKCPKFLQMSQSQRYDAIKKNNLCINCFSKVHTLRNCTSKFSCYKCNKKHNTLLHKEGLPSNSSTHSSTPPPSPSNSSQPGTSNSIQSTESSSGNIIQSCFSSNSRGVLLGTALVTVCHGGLEFAARALVDSGSEGTLISERLFNVMGLPFRRTSAQISGLNNSISASVRKECTFTLRSTLNGEFELSASALVVPHLAGGLPSRTLDPGLLSSLPDIPLADPYFFRSSKVDLLLGGDLLPSIMLSGIRSPVCGSLMAQETVFGWILTGPVPVQSTGSFSTIVSYFCEISLDKEISRFWEVEELPRRRFLSPSDQFCEDLFLRTTTRSDDGRYVVSLPFKEEFPSKVHIGESRNGSMAQFYKNEARLLRTPEFKAEYDDVLEEYVRLDHMRMVPPPCSRDSTRFYYLPHHAVIKPESTTTKVRVVFNASSSTSNGTSLNDVLYPGPVLQKDLTILILKWRFFQFVFNGDISKMYRQILVNPSHASFQRILFRRSPDLPIQDYELRTVTFGVNCAPYLAIRTLLQLAEDVQSIYPLASDILRNSMYVDDALVGAHSVSDAIGARLQLVQALKSAGFQMRKWTSNSRDILSDIPSEDLLRDDFLQFDDRSTAKTLGIRWNAMSDCFYFSIQPFPATNAFSKREVLSQISKLFNPAGWLSPCIIIAKIIMQQIWMEKTDWDEIISPSTLSQWRLFQDNYLLINQIRVPRWFQYIPNSKIQFHGFCDASEKAYAAVLYVRIEVNDSIATNLVLSKTRVAPIKTLSIPRLELCGAALLADMIDGIIPQLNVDSYSIYCWTDSTIVLSWLSKPPCYWATFVANRVSKIVEVISPSNWSHVTSECNPADLASRGVYPRDLLESRLWWKGPQWLMESCDSWPVTGHVPSEIIEIERKSLKVNFTYFNHFEDILDRFSSFSRALRVVSYIYRFYFRTHSKYRSDFRADSRVLSNSEVTMTRDRLIAMSQKAFYPREYLSLSLKNPILKSSSLLNLNPFCDSEGVLRICGRLTSSPFLTYNERHPVILPYNCQFSRLLVRFVHEISLHGGNQLVLRLIRMQYWIPKVKNLIKTVINKCKPCILYRRRCQTQLMSALPPERAEISRPFVHTGLDFAGPFDIKYYGGRGCRMTKGYVCVFVCFSTKAIHLEATSDLSTSAFLAAFSRFIARRGCPLHIHSDNGTTFVGASRSLAKEFIRSSQEAILSGYAHQNISWHFIPPGAPHMGGLWEAGVKSFKLHFRKVAGNVKYTFEEFQTLLSKIESCLNSRPLSPMSQSPSDFDALTPGHFLIGSPILAPIDPNVREAPMSLLNRWQRLQSIHQHFCARWKDEYLKELHKRHKWQRPTENLEENMLVVVRDENTPPNTWRLGRISKIYFGSDRRVRVADVVTEKGVITRPITKLVILPSEST
ncbi:uncharacterized protein LOC131996637 [Stomoxys calcitrans]|uniref:uncharacterized protein LOC131996637 n=1 Tax=Stomoxys calcitrans TaxID=35570 RepID=UPI0027E24DF5|nr:uncharacterized protein LOC131996637 [Stomoxys calcitrans]